MHANPDTPPKWVRWLWEVDASEAAEKQEEGKGLGVGKIVRAGIALADDEGLEGVSVRKLAQRLGVSTMAAYRHISSRDEVIAPWSMSPSGHHQSFRISLRTGLAD